MLEKHAPDLGQAGHRHGRHRAPNEGQLVVFVGGKNGGAKDEKNQEKDPDQRQRGKRHQRRRGGGGHNNFFVGRRRRRPFVGQQGRVPLIG